MVSDERWWCQGWEIKLKEVVDELKNVTLCNSSTTNQLAASRPILSEQNLLASAHLVKARSCALGEVESVEFRGML